MENLIDLINKAKSGNKEAFGSIYKLYYEKIYRFIYYLVFDKHLAADLTQNTFLKMWHAIPKFRTKNGTIQSYLFTIARNLVIDFRRKKKELTLDLAQDISKDEDLITKISNGEQNEMLRDTLNALDEEERQLLILRFFEDLSMLEIAKVFNKQEGAIRVRIHRILKKMRQYITQKYAN